MLAARTPVAAKSAAVIAWAAVCDASLSATRLRTGAGSPVAGSACTAARPEYAWITLSYTFLCAYGPSSPKPEIETYTTSGRTRRASSYPTPIRSTTPGRKFCTITSAVA